MNVLSNMQTYEVPANVLDRFREFTGLMYGSDPEFVAAAATIVAQTVLSIFLTITAFVLILFLEPPARPFAGWTEVGRDRRPALMALGLFVVLLAILVTPPLAHYFALYPVGFGAAGAIGVAVIL